MNGGWTEDVVFWTNFLGFTWDILNVSTTSFIEFERKVDVRTYEFGWVRFQNSFFKIIK